MPLLSGDAFLWVSAIDQPEERKLMGINYASVMLSKITSNE